MDVKRGWSSLPLDVLSEVAIKLDTVEDFVYFSMVCHTWNCASSVAKLNWCSRIPWLLLAENTTNNDEYLRKLFSFNTRRCYQLKLPQTFGVRCWGSSCGWIAMIDLNQQISLFNPLTQAQIFLPSQTTMPYQQNDLRVEFLHVPYNVWHRNYFMHKIFVWKLADDDLLAIAIHRNNKKMSFARPGDEVWTAVITPNKLAFEVVRWGDKMLIMYQDGGVGYCELSRAHSLRPLEAMEFVPSPSGSVENFYSKMLSLYMVDAFGDLLRVIRHKTALYNQDRFFKTQSFEVFRLSFETKEWEQLQDLGDYSLFVGENCSMSVRASPSNNVRPNCIYYTDDQYHIWNLQSFFGPHDLGVYDLKSKEFMEFYAGDDTHSTFCTPLWFLPSF